MIGNICSMFCLVLLLELPLTRPGQLLESNPKLHFAMLRLHLIELIRTRVEKDAKEMMPAVHFSSRNLAPLASQHPEFIEDLNIAMALMIYPPDKRPAKVAALLEPSLRQSIAEEVNKTIRGSTGGRDVELIRMLLRARAWGEQQVRAAGKDLPADLGIGLDPPSHGNGSYTGHQAQNGSALNGDAEAMDQ
jgi:glucose-induced degradation protein 8